MRIVALTAALLLALTGCRGGSFNPDEVDADEDGFALGVDCDDDDPLVNPDADEICDGRDNNCDGSNDEGTLFTWYADSDGDGFGGTQFTAEACEAPEGYSSDSSDCDDLDPNAFPGNGEICDLADNNCNGTVDEGFTSTWYADSDADGYGNPNALIETCTPTEALVDNGDDCNDANPSAFPGGTETCDGQDEDCDGVPDNGLDMTVYTDHDGDGYGETGTDYIDCELGDSGAAVAGDCDDTDADANPAATEVCDGKDNNCDGTVDEGQLTTYYQDGDGDLFGDADISVQACTQPSNYVADGTDCDDGAAGTYPGAAEACDGKDNNCDGTADEGVSNVFYRDRDSDGYGDSGDQEFGCVLPPGFSSQGGDCDDNEAAANPGRDEICDLIDNNCNGSVDEDGLTTWYLDSDSDGYGANASSTASCSAPSANHVVDGDDCDDTDDNNFPGNAEACDGQDNNCDTVADEGVTTTVYRDVDGDGYGDPSNTDDRCSDGGGYVLDNTDCDDNAAGSNPEADETCDGQDNDCDTSVDEGVTVDLYTDGDADGYGSGFSRSGCTPGIGESNTNDDCDDNDSSIFPGATDAPGDGIDQDCDGIDPTLDVGTVCYGDTSVITMGQMLESSIDDTDQSGGPRGSTFRFEDHELVLDGGTTYTISANSETIDTYVYVLDETCAVVASRDDGAGVNFNTGFTFTPDDSTVYTLVVTTFTSSDRGAYRLRVSEGDAADNCLDDTRVIGLGEETTFTLSSADSTNGPISGARYRDFGIWLEAGEQLSAQAMGNVPAYVAVLDDGCVLDAENRGTSYTDNARLSYTAPEAGIYTIVAGTDTPGETGTLTLQVAKGRVGYNCFGDPAVSTLPRTYAAAELSGGDSTSGGPLGNNYTWDDYEVIAGPGMGVIGHGVSPELELWIEAYDEDCNLATDSLEDFHAFSDSLGVHANPTEWAQIITFAVSADAPNTLGRHTFSMAAMPPWDTCGTDARGLTIGEQIHEVLRSSDDQNSPQTGEAWDDYELWLEAGQTVNLVAGSATEDISIAVLDEFCSVVGGDTDSGEDDTAYLEFTAPFSGVYTVAASSEFLLLGDTEYYVQASPEPLESSCWNDDRQITAGGGFLRGEWTSSSATGQRGSSYYQGDVDLYLAAGQEVQIDLTADVDTYMYLLDEDCTVVGSNDDVSYPTNTNSRITYTAPTAGVYTVVATTFFSNVTDDYLLTTTALTEF